MRQAMKDNTSKNTTPKAKFIKRIMGIAVPALVIVITIIMVSVSFAWFSNDVTPAVSTINLTVGKSFTILFNSDESEADLRNINYKGQTAIDGNYRLVTDHNGRTHSSLGGAGLEQYMLDAPYYFITTITLDTEGKDVDMNMALDAVKIVSGGSVLNSYSGEVGNTEGKLTPLDVPYAFTWYFTEHNGDTVNFKGNIVGDDDRRVMDNRMPKDGDVWYTPYGKLVFDANGMVASVNGTDIDNSAAGYSALNEGLQDVKLNASMTEFDFYIVFAPQKLFWSQFFLADINNTVNDIYDGQEIQKIFGRNTDKQMYYSSIGYFGATFEFGATLYVSRVY